VSLTFAQLALSRSDYPGGPDGPNVIEGFGQKVQPPPLARAIEVDPRDIDRAVEDTATLIRSDWGGVASHAAKNRPRTELAPTAPQWGVQYAQH
jgi:hypothetical protein